jgi:nucleoside-diphosphate-sugar epimerase
LKPEPPAGTPDHEQWSYGIGKRRAEHAVLERRAFGVRSVILRLPVLVGEGDTSLRLWSYLERMLDGGPIVLPGGGARSLRFLHPGDVGRAVVSWLEHGLPRGPVYNLAQPEIVTLRATLEAIAAAAGLAPRYLDLPEAEIERAGIDRSFSPWSGPWVSVLDPGRAAAEWSFAGTAMESYLAAAVRAHLDRRPAASHPGYRHRAREIALAESAGTGARGGI